MIPPDITRDEILAALHEIDDTGEPYYRESTRYSLLYKNRLYSPKYVVSVVVYRKTGKELASKDFKTNTAKNFLIDYHFPILHKKDLDDAVSKMKSIVLNQDRDGDLTVISARDTVYDRYSPVFSSGTLSNLTSEELKTFLDLYDTKHGTGVPGAKRSFLSNIAGIQKILQILLDESLHIDDRFQIIEKKAEEEEIEGLGKGILTTILHVAYPDRYGVWDGTSEDGLKRLKVWPTFQQKATEGEKYAVINEILRYLSVQTGVDLRTLDTLWRYKESLYPSLTRFWKIAPDKEAKEWSSWREKNIIAIYWSELLHETGPDILTMPYEEIVSVYKEVYPNISKPLAVRQIYNFLHEMKPGDKVVINKGKKSILAYGQIESEARYDDRQAATLYRNISWEKTDADIPIPDLIKGKFMQTVVELTEDEYYLLTGSELKYWGILPSEGLGRPGTELFYWDTWKERGIVTTSYWKDFISSRGESLLHLSEEEYLQAFRDFHPEKKHADMIWKFIHQMQIGDKILLNRGKKTIFAVGEVLSDPFLDESGGSFVRKVRWNSLPDEIPIPERLKNRFSRYIISITPQEFQQIMQSEQIPDEYIRLDRLLQKKGQVILYGPPGTGKTYHSSRYIAYKQKNYPQTVKTKGEISRNFYWFTINPSRWDPENLWNDQEVELWYGNMKVAFSEIEESDLVFCYVSGTNYHRLTGIATCIRKVFSSDGIPQVFIKAIQKIEGPDWKTLKSDGILSESFPVRTGARGTLFSLTPEEGLRILSLLGIPPRDIGIEEQISTLETPSTQVVTFHPSFSYEEFIEGIMPMVGIDGTIRYQVREGIFKSLCRTAFNSLLQYLHIEKVWNPDADIPVLSPDERDLLYSQSSDIPHFLMIDEINRGDISRIFGELITLLERDKRAAGPHELSVILPYSRTRFAIPPNLYIIGTMNTADKSIALVDIALRRRFGFIGMLPDQAILREYLSHDSLEIQKIYTLAIDILEEINGRISKEFDCDHQLGHSYLMRLKGCDSLEETVSEFWSIWYDEMLPLLQEYFYDAPTRLHTIIGDGFVEYNTHSLILYPEKDEEEFLEALRNILKTESV